LVAVALPTLLLLLSSTLTGHLEFLKHPSQSANKPDQQAHYSSTLSTCSTLRQSCGQRLFPYYIILFILCEDKERSTATDYSLPSGKSRSPPLDDRIPARSPHISPTRFPESGRSSNGRITAIIALHRFLVCEPPNNRVATHSCPSAPWCHRNAQLHSEAQPCANETTRLQLLTRPYEDHHRAGTTKHLCRKTSSTLSTLTTTFHPTSLDRSRPLMKV
jgi:hypothetical protein